MLCIGANLWAWQQPPAFAQHNLVVIVANLRMGRLWTLVVALFVHGNPLHLFGNMLFLFVFGRTLGKAVGAGRELLIFFTGGVASFLLSMPFMPRSAGMLGASAAIFTLATTVMLVNPLRFSCLCFAPRRLVGRHCIAHYYA